MPNLQQQTSTSDQAQMPPHQSESLFIDVTDSAAFQQDEDWRTKGIARKPLVRYPDFHITLMAIKGGARIEEHHNPGRISVHTVKGHIRMHAAGQTFDLPQGRVLVLDRRVRHDVEALEDSVFLLTAVLPGGQPSS